MRSLRTRTGFIVAAIALAVAGCSDGGSAEPPASGSGGGDTGSQSEPSSDPPRDKHAKDTAWGPTGEELDQAAAYADDLTTEELAGQLVVATYDGTAAPTDLVDDLHLGGVIVMEPNIESVDQISAVNDELQQGRDYPLWIGVDQEGGIVNRLTDTMTPFPTYMTYGAAGEPGLATRSASGSGAELRDAGFTAVYAPDADVTAGPQDPTIGSRSAGSRPALVSEMVRASVRGYESAG
ncbi:MAG: glycoside hydrolase family 3 N-terminal domain-containing protein, partial [Nocardioidaceae bacterium]